MRWGLRHLSVVCVSSSWYVQGRACGACRKSMGVVHGHLQGIIEGTWRLVEAQGSPNSIPLCHMHQRFTSMCVRLASKTAWRSAHKLLSSPYCGCQIGHYCPIFRTRCAKWGLGPFESGAPLHMELHVPRELHPWWQTRGADHGGLGERTSVRCAWAWCVC